jgi:hypothetical protein
MRYLFAFLFCLWSSSFASPEPTHQRIIIDGNTYALGSSLSNTFYYLKVPEQILNLLLPSIETHSSNNASFRLFQTGCISSGNPTWEIKSGNLYLKELTFCENPNSYRDIKIANAYTSPLLAEWISGNFVIQERIISSSCKDLEKKATIKASFYSFKVDEGRVTAEKKFDESFNVPSFAPVEYKCK